MFLMRDEKEERKQGQSKAKQHMYVYVFEKEERKKQTSNKQTRQSKTAHPRQSLFLEKNELPQVRQLERSTN